MINNLLLTGKLPACRCALCAARRATSLTEALQKKYFPVPKVMD